MTTFDTPGPITTVLDIPAGSVRFIAADRTDTTVEVRPADATKSRDVKAAEQAKVAYGNGVLTVEATTNRIGNSGAIDVMVQLPAGSKVEAKAAAAEVRGVGRLGDVTFEGSQGAIKLDEAQALDITTHAGDVTVGRLTGSAEITTGKGDITIGVAHGLSASLDAGTQLGRIHNELKNDGATSLTIRATTAMGDITARSL